MSTHPAVKRLALVAEVVNLDNLGVDQVCDQFALPDEILDELALHREPLVHHLNRHLLGEALRADLVGTEYRAHPAVGDLLDDLEP